MYTHVRVAAAAVALSGLVTGALAVGAADATPARPVATAHADAKPGKPATPKKCHQKHGKKLKQCKKKHQGARGGKHGGKNDGKGPKGQDPTAIPMPTAPEPIVLSWAANATTTVKKLGQRVDFPTTSFTGTIQPLERTLAGPLVLPPAKTSVKLGDLDLVRITMEAADPSPVSATIDVDDTLWTVHAQQTFAIKIRRLSGPANLVNLVKPGCGTAPTTADLTGTVDFAKVGQPGGPGDYTMSGSYTIPEFTGCGPVMSSLLTSLVSGPGNPLSVHFTG